MKLDIKKILLLFFLIGVFIWTIFLIKKNITETSNRKHDLNDLMQANYFKRLVVQKTELKDEKSLNEHFEANKNSLITIGCVAKGITGAGIVLFSQDKENQYLFKNKDLDITIGELLSNRKKHLDSIKNLTEIQKRKLNFINRLIEYISEDIRNEKVYKILNHTSMFADDFNEYILYSVFQKFVNGFPEDTRTELLMKGIQIMSMYYKTKNTQIDKYSNMGFMYIISIMNLMTDKENFYQEVVDRIFKPLNLENKFIAGHKLDNKQLRSMFKNRNYATKYKNYFIKVDLHDLTYNEMDTLNGGLVSNLESINIVGDEIAKMYFGFDNLLTNNTGRISDLFFKYKTYRTSSYDFYSLGTIIEVEKNGLKIKMRGNLFGYTIVLEYIIDRIKDGKTEISATYTYNKDEYKKKIKNEIYIDFKNYFLELVFFQNGRYFSSPFKDILLKSIIDEYGTNGSIDIDTIEHEVNFKRSTFIEKLKNRSIKNTKNLIENTEYKNHILNMFTEYFEKLKEI